jgi:hypothetical protein
VTKRASNHHISLVSVIKADDTNTRVSITQDYMCGGLFGNICCLNDWDTRLWIGEREHVFDRKSACECVAAHGVSDQECPTYTSGWCGVHGKKHHHQRERNF